MPSLMRTMKVLGFVILALLVQSCTSGTDSDVQSARSNTGSVFSKMKFEEGKDKATKDSKLFIVDATASWCGPCKRMEQTTWINPKVVEWFNERALAVQIDVDEQKQLSMDLKIEAMPTIIVFKDGVEFDRVVGYKTSDELLAWLEDVRQGNRAIDAVRAAAGDRSDPNAKIDIRARYDLAGTLARTDKLDEATGEYVWLWNNIVKYDPSYSAVRLSFMVGEITSLVRRHEPARKAFADLRNQAQPAIDDGTADREVFLDWLALNKVLGDEETIIAWFDRVKDKPERLAVNEFAGDDLFDLLIKRGRWSDAAGVYADPVKSVQRGAAILHIRESSEMDDATKASIRRIQAQRFRTQASRMYAACLVGGKDESASRVAAILLAEQDDATSRTVLVETALKAGAPRPSQRQWLDEAEAKGEKATSLREQLEKALTAKNPTGT